LDWVVAHQHDVTSDGPVFVHRDFHADNILLKDHPEPGGENAVVLDWTAASLTDYRFDLAWTLLLVGANQGWELRELFLREYERQAQKTVTGMELFDVAASCSRLFYIVHSLSCGAEAVGFRPGTEHKMRRLGKSTRRVYEHQLSLTGITIPEVEAFLNDVKA
jgi:thiamine kinase-like enzyme